MEKEVTGMVMLAPLLTVTPVPSMLVSADVFSVPAVSREMDEFCTEVGLPQLTVPPVFTCTSRFCRLVGRPDTLTMEFAALLSSSKIDGSQTAIL